MTKSKKYYWLKLKDDFFTTREVKKLRRIAGGDTYTIIYLKMQLLSIKKEGLIMYEGTEACLTEQLALELDEDEDNVKMTLAFLQANKLIEQLSEDEYLLNKVPESIGSETGAAERMRRMREKRNNVTPQLQGVTNSYTEIEIRDREDIEIEIDKEIDKEYSAYFEEMWSLYPNKKGKGRVSNSKKKELLKLGDEFKRSISRYIDEVERKRINGFKELQYQNGSTFFNSGYIDYLDENYKEMKQDGEYRGNNKEDEYSGLGWSFEDMQGM